MLERTRLLPGARGVEANVSRGRCLLVLHMKSVVWQFTCISHDNSHVQPFVSHMTVICQSYDNSHMFHMTSHMYNSHVCSLSDLRRERTRLLPGTRGVEADVSRRGPRHVGPAGTHKAYGLINSDTKRNRFFALSQNAFFGWMDDKMRRTSLKMTRKNRREYTKFRINLQLNFRKFSN